MKKNKIIIIAGPTASGKTSFSIELAKQISAEIVNFDSLLFYKELNIGTAKPSDDEQENIPHHLISTHSISTPINAADYFKIAPDIINDILKRGKTPIIVGGSGFYLQALLYGMYESITTSDEIIKRSNELYANEGISPFIEILKTHDEKSHSRYHENDHYRIRRAVEHFWMTNTPFSQVRENMDKNSLNSPLKKYNWEIMFNYLDVPKPEHQEIIETRTQSMIEQGLVDEVQNLLNQGFSGEEKPLKSIGYKEVIDYLQGIYKDIDDCKERIIISTRQLAKAQRTWFKKLDKISYNSLVDKEAFIENCQKFIKDM